MSELTKPVVSGPKPFVFVLMPFDRKFNAVYELAIKAAADAAGAYAERVDKQHHTGSIYERIVNQIAKADFIVADTTGKNANVFYEVGYAHAIGKQVILITKTVNDIPFDLKDRQHIVYRNDLIKLRDALALKLEWAIANPELAFSTNRGCPIELRLNGVVIPESRLGKPPQVPMKPERDISAIRCKFHFRNRSTRATGYITNIYLLTPSNGCIVPYRPNNEYVEPLFIHSDDEEAAQGFERRYPLGLNYLNLEPYQIQSESALFSFFSKAFGPLPVRIELLAMNTAYRFDFVPVLCETE